MIHSILAGYFSDSKACWPFLLWIIELTPVSVA
jgi:hypothetical protein